MIYGELMRNIKLLFILLSLITFSSYALAQTPEKVPSKKFLRAKKHIKSVAKETQKLEKTLSEPELKEAVEPVKKPVEEDLSLTPPENETPAVNEAPTAKETIGEDKIVEEHKSEQPGGWLFSIETNANKGMIRANDSYGRKLNLTSSLGFGGYVLVGYRFDRYLALVADYHIDRVGFDSFDTYIVTQSNHYLMSGRLGPRFYLTNRFSVDILAGLGQNYAIYPTNITNINVEKFNHGSMALGFNYATIKGDNFWLSGRTELDIYLSTTNSVFKTSTGLGANTSFKFGIPIGDKSSFYLNLGVGYINLKIDIASQYGLFGFGGIGFMLEN